MMKIPKRTLALLLGLSCLCACGPATPKHATLWEAISAGNVKSVKTLIANGANVNQHGWTGGTTLLIYATEKGHIEIMKTLISAGANLDANDKQ